jgi:Sulfatase
MRFQSARIAALQGCVFVVLYAALNHVLVDRLFHAAGRHELGTFIKVIGLLLCGSAGVYWLASTARHPMRWILWLSMWVSASAGFAISWICETNLSADVLAWGMAERDHLPHALAMYWRKLVLALGFAFCLLMSLRWLGPRLHIHTAGVLPHWRRLLGWLGMGALLCSFVSGLAVPTVGLNESGAWGMSLLALRSAQPQLGHANTMPMASSWASKIVLVVDESVAADDFKQVVKHTLTPDTIDYGRGFSTGNCSAASNALLRWGLRPGDVGSAADPRSNVSLWAYARRAGYQTILLDGQVPAGRRQNFISDEEAQLIDSHQGLSHGLDTDFEIARQLAAELGKPGKAFIYVVKRGAHVPYTDNLPPHLHDSALSARQSYQRVLQFSTVGFFAELKRLQPRLEDAVLFYTSDHGQLFDGGASHCRYAPELLEQWHVPIVVLTDSERAKQALVPSTGCWQDRASHQHLRSTAIEAMGYPWTTQRADEFPTLTDCAAKPVVPRLLTSLPFPTPSRQTMSVVLTTP